MKHVLIAMLSVIFFAGNICAQEQVPVSKTKADSLLRALSSRSRPVSRPDSGAARPRRFPRATPAAAPAPTEKPATTTPATTTAPASAPAATAPVANVPAGNFTVNNYTNGLDIKVTQCTGNPGEQSVTIYFTFANPNRSHQSVSVAYQASGYKTNALDKESHPFYPGAITLGGETSTNKYRSVNKQLPTGNTLNGSVTFTNVLPATKEFAQVYLIAETKNWVGGQAKYGGMIEIVNVPINWK